MSDKDVDTSKYQGPGRIASAYGDAALYNAGGMLAGGAATAAGAAAILRPEGNLVKPFNGLLAESIHADLRHAERMLAKAQARRDLILKPKKGERVFATLQEVETEISRAQFTIENLETKLVHVPKIGKITAVTAVALAGAAVVGTVGMVYGAVHGWNKASRGKKQFEALKEQRDKAVGTLNGVGQVLGTGPRRGYAAALEAESQNQSETSRG